jgi:protein SCO1/2
MKRYWLGFLLIILGIGGFAAGRFLHAGDDRPADIYGSVPDFSFTESSGRSVGLHDLLGKVWVVDFIFTHCAGTCPLMTAEMKRLRSSFPQDIAFVSITVDPAHDTPEVLAQYAKQNGADSRNWMFLTGSRTALRALMMGGFKLPLDDTQGSDSEPITHSSRFVLVDKKGRIRGYYDGTDDADVKRLTNDARQLR